MLRRILKDRPLRCDAAHQSRQQLRHRVKEQGAINPRVGRAAWKRRKNASMSRLVRSRSRTLEASRLKVRLSTIERMQKGPSDSSSAAMKPEKSDSAQSR